MHGRVVVITGGASGIGRAAVQLCAERGATVAVLDLDGATAQSVAQHATHAYSGRGLGLGCDVADEDAVAAAYATILERLGPVHALFANAGIETSGPAHEMPRALWDQVLRTNLDGAFFTCRQAIGHMLEHHIPGSIVCTSSPAAFVGFAGGGAAAYGASKGGVSSMVRTLALDYAPAGIRINALVPGATDTPMMWSQLSSSDAEQDRRDLEGQAAQAIPLGRLGHASEVAQAAVWLMSDDASYVTGTHLFCDGGLAVKSANTF